MSAGEAERIERSRWFALGPGDRVVDEGLVRLRGGGFFDRDEAFSLLAHANGGFSLTSVTSAVGGAYRFDCLWRYDAGFSGISARGIGVANGQPIEVEILTHDGRATVHVMQNGIARIPETFAIPPGAMIDIEPAALPTFTMMRRFDSSQGGVQDTRWIGRSMLRDSTLTHGIARTRMIGTVEAGGRRALHFAFLEEMGDPAAGPVFTMPFQLWTDTARNPVKFMVRGAQSSVIGVRAGWETVAEALAPVDFQSLR